MKRLFKILVLLILILTFSSCKGREEVTIIYTNDIHGYIANTVKDSSGKEVDGLRLSKIAGYVKSLRNDNKNVVLVDAGDEVQGSIYGAIDKGAEMIGIMNKVGYELATPGNHDFDFGIEGFNRFKSEATFPYISCNFKTSDNKNVLDSYKIFDISGIKIGFVGISTPETITTSTPTFFKNDKGEFIYEFVGEKNKEDLYKIVQDTVDEIRGKVDYVIALGHLGVGLDEERLGIASKDVIKNTTGIDAFIDGHSHTTVESDLVKSKDNKDCVLTQTGCYLDAIGEMTIGLDGKITTKLNKELSIVDEEVKTLENSLIQKVNTELGKSVANLEKTLYIYNSQLPEQRLIRARETNMGNFISDSVYWYLNDYKNLDCDLTLINGGGMRSNIDSGSVTYLNAKSVQPYGNQVCLIKTKGINIKNALEMGLTVFEKWDTQWNCPAENGGFLHAAGLTFEADGSIPSSVTLDDKNMFKSVDGAYRVKNIKVYNKQTKAYEPLDENKEYTVGGINYILRNSGNGLSMFAGSEVVVDYVAEDYTISVYYMEAFKNANGEVVVNNANSPIKKYENYLFDYENPNGSGRITLQNINH